MMFLDSGKSIADKIEILMREPVSEPIRLAVAFWGSGTDKKISRSCQIICDLGSGACDPEVIRKLRQRTNCIVRKRSRLHAKVVIGSEGAIVSSANMSANGLGAQSGAESGTIEAGCYISNSSPEFAKITAWFEEQWQDATEISESDLLEAKKRWDLRQRNGLSTPDSDRVPSEDAVPIDPSSLLQPKIAKGDRLLATKPQIFDQIALALPGIDPRRQGKIASWACHLLLINAGVTLVHSAGKKEPVGPATEEWIVSRFGKKKKREAALQVEAVLRLICETPSFSPNVKRAANRAISRLRPHTRALTDDNDACS